MATGASSGKADTVLHAFDGEQITDNARESGKVDTRRRDEKRRKEEKNKRERRLMT
jgi:hypothetical protein